MKGIMYGYVRVSTREQREDRQLAAMREFGVERERVVVEKQSGKDFDRPRYQALVEGMNAGDVLVIKSIDRLGRNYEEILEQWRWLPKAREISIVVLDMPLLDTRQGRDLTGVLVADIVLQLLSYVAQQEREFIRQRQAEGIAAAKEKGIHLGRERIVMPGEFETVAQQWWDGEITGEQAAVRLGLSRRTFCRRAKEWGVAEGLTHRVVFSC